MMAKLTRSGIVSSVLIIAFALQTKILREKESCESERTSERDRKIAQELRSEEKLAKVQVRIAESSGLD